MRNANGVHEDGACEGDTKRELILDRGGRQTFEALVKYETAHFVVPFAAGPDDKYVATIHGEVVTVGRRSCLVWGGTGSAMVLTQREH